MSTTRGPLRRLVQAVVFLGACGCAPGTSEGVFGDTLRELVFAEEQRSNEICKRVFRDGSKATARLLPYLESSDDSLHLGALKALRWAASRGVSGIRESLMDVVRDEHVTPPGRGGAAAVVSGMGPEGVDALSSVLDQLDVVGQREVARILGQHEVLPPASIDALARALSSTDAGVRDAAADSLIQFPRDLSRHVPQLVTALGFADGSSAATVGRVLTRMGHMVLPEIIKTFGSTDAAINNRVYWIVMGIGEPAVEPLVGVLVEMDKARVLRAISLLHKLGPKARSAIPALKVLMASAEEEIRYWAGVAVEVIEK